MATPDRTELLGEYQQAWKDLEDILWERALALKPKFRGTLSEVLDFLKRNRVMSKPEWIKMVLLQGTRDEVLYDGAELKPEMVDKIVSLAAEWEKRQRAFLEAQEEQAKAAMVWRRLGMRKISKKMKDMKILFLGAVGIAMIALSIEFVILVKFDWPIVPLTGSEISFFNLLIDIAVGVFTIWGLGWAASEFAGTQVKPDLHLIIGKESEDQQGIDPLTNEADALIGRDVSTKGGVVVSRVIVGLFLENHRPKPAQYVRIELWVRDVPHPKEFVRNKEYFKFEVRDFAIRGQAVVLQFGEDLVVYGGTGVYLGKIPVDWPQGTHPERIAFKAKLHNLESNQPKEVTVSRPIHWM